MIPFGRCRKATMGGCKCVFTMVDNEGNIPENNCILKMKDDYSMFPVISSQPEGMMIHEFEHHDPHPIPNGKRNHQYEMLTGHFTTGDEYIGRRMDYDHPLYHMIEYNVPESYSEFLDEYDQCEVYGENILSISRGRFYRNAANEAYKPIGIPKVAVCTGIYGYSGIHKSMRNYQKHFKNWVNYTSSPDEAKMTFNIFEDNLETIESFVTSILDEHIGSRLMETYCYLLDGTYVNTYELLKNNKVPKESLQKIYRNISTKNIKDVYKTSDNLEKIWLLYSSLKDDKISFGDNIPMMKNIVNWILNSSVLAKIALIPNKTYKPGERFWYGLKIIEHAYQAGLCKDYKFFPKWFQDMYKYYLNNKNTYRFIGGVSKSLAECSEDELSEIAESTKLKLNKVIGNDVIGPAALYPTSFLVTDIIDVSKHLDEYDRFKKILKIPNRISPHEIKVMWEYWVIAMDRDRPDVFWNRIYDMTAESSEAAQDIWDSGESIDSFDVDSEVTSSLYFPVQDAIVIDFPEVTEEWEDFLEVSHE